jgi:hypothetical protein
LKDLQGFFLRCVFRTPENTENPDTEESRKNSHPNQSDKKSNRIPVIPPPLTVYKIQGVFFRNIFRFID